MGERSITPTETGREGRTDARATDWKAGALGGFAGGVVMGSPILATNAAVIAVAIQSLYSLAPPPNVPLGMAVHVFHGAVSGLVSRESRARWGPIRRARSSGSASPGAS